MGAGRPDHRAALGGFWQWQPEGSMGRAAQQRQWTYGHLTMTQLP